MMSARKAFMSMPSIIVIAVGFSMMVFSSKSFSMELTLIGNPGNDPDYDHPYGPPYDPTYVGGVDYIYQIGTYEVTVDQYTDFLNAKAQSDSYGLYDNSMATGGGAGGGFLYQNGSEGSYSYTAQTGKEDQPVRCVTFFDALRFCNWLSNGKADGDTESGSYDMSKGYLVDREPGATWVLPSEDEWYKAAYYDPDTGVYYDYPNGTDDVPAEPTDGTSPREMNFGDTPFWHGTVCFTSAGETTGQSPYGTYDQGGNVAEWLETASVQFPDRNIRGGSFVDDIEGISANQRDGADPGMEGDGFGFRVALIPEPSTGLLVLLGVLGFLFSRRK